MPLDLDSVPETATRLFHKPIPGDQWMPMEWCGGCDTCIRAFGYPPEICQACSYSGLGYPAGNYILWEHCPFNIDREAVTP